MSTIRKVGNLLIDVGHFSNGVGVEKVKNRSSGSYSEGASSTEGGPHGSSSCDSSPDGDEEIVYSIVVKKSQRNKKKELNKEAHPSTSPSSQVEDLEDGKNLDEYQNKLDYERNKGKPNRGQVFPEQITNSSGQEGQGPTSGGTVKVESVRKVGTVYYTSDTLNETTSGCANGHNGENKTVKSGSNDYEYCWGLNRKMEVNGNEQNAAVVTSQLKTNENKLGTVSKSTNDNNYSYATSAIVQQNANKPEATTDNINTVVQFTVNSLGMLPLTDDDLTGTKSGPSIQRCISILSKSSTADNAVYEWSRSLDLQLTLEGNMLKLINPKKKMTVLSHPLRAIRIWGFPPDSGSTYFSYVMRDDQTTYICRVFKCSVPGIQVAGAMRDRCIQRVQEKQKRLSAGTSSNDQQR